MAIDMKSTKNRLMTAIVLTMASAAGLHAQVTSRSALTTAPASVLPTLPQTTRLDMIDYYDSGIEKNSLNQLEGETRITSLEDRILTMTNGKASEITIAVLPAGKKELIMVINSLSTPAIDSSVDFYDSKWNRLNRSKLLPEPTLKDWTGKLSADERLDIENALPFIMTDISYDPASGILTMTPTFKDYVPEENLATVSSKIKACLKYRWTGKRFVKTDS